MNYRGELRSASLRERCRELRRNATPAERRLWELLKGRQLDGWKFRRQHQFGPFILDFFCPASRLAIEVDGPVHWTAQAEMRDEIRTEFLEENGIRVLRFTNDEVLHRTDAVLVRIQEAVADEDWDEVPEPPRVIVFDPDFLAPSPFR
ncbi:MAG TPA: endonuclease domain-containing protein [Myxococcales bacterium]